MNLPVSSALLMAALLSILWSITKLIINSGNKEKGFLLPGPRGLPVVGFLPFLRRDLHRQFTELAGRYGPIYKLWLGSKVAVVISSPSLIKEVVRDQDTIFANRVITVAARIATYDAKDISFSPYGPLWRDMRKMFTREMMSPASLEASFNLRRDEVRKGIKKVYSKIVTPVEIYDLVSRMDLSLIINMIFGGATGTERRERILETLYPVISETLDLVLRPNISDFVPMLARFDIQGIAKRTTALVLMFDSIIAKTIDERMEDTDGKSKPTVSDNKEPGRTDFLQTLIDRMQQEDKKEASFGKEQIKAMLGDIIIAGTETSASAVEWAMAELLRHPEVMDKVQTELDHVVGLDNIVEEFHVTKLDYLDAVIKETLRVHPLSPFIGTRTPNQSCTVGGYTVPKDSIVFLNVWSAQRDPLVWSDPLEFKPERFLGNATKKWDFLGNNFSYLPFGSGRRICAGIPLAERMVRYILASLLHSFEWRRANEETLDMSDKLVSALRKRIPLCAVAAPRLSRLELYQ